MPATLNPFPGERFDLEHIRSKVEKAAGDKPLEKFIADRLNIGPADVHLNTVPCLNLLISPRGMSELVARVGYSKLGAYVANRLTEPTPAQVAA